MKKLLMVLLLCFVSVFGWGADKTVTVKPSGGDYTTLALAVAGELTANANLVTMEGILHIKIEGDWSGGADTTNVDGNGFTTSAAYYVHIYTDSANRASASGWSTSKYILQDSNDFILTLRDNHMRVDGLQIEITGLDANYEAPIYIYGQSVANDIRVSSCRLKANNDGTYRNRGLTVSDAEAIVKIWNVIVTGVNTLNVSCGCISVISASTVDIYNCTFYGGRHGVHQTAGTVTAKNIVAFNHTTDFDGTITVDWCASDDNTGTNNVAESGGGAAWPDDFEGAATGDFRLKSTSNLVGAVTDQSGGLFTDDIEGTTRGAAWDVGAFEYVSSGLTFTAHKDVILGFSLLFNVFCLGAAMLLIRKNKALKRELAFFQNEDYLEAWCELNQELK